MHQVLEQILDHLRGAWRFRWFAFATAAGICAIGWAVVFVLPDTYRASARVFVDSRTTLSEVTQGISVEANVETQINRVRQAMLGAPQLQRVGEQTDLFKGAVTPREKQAVIDRLRKELQITTSTGTPNGIGSVYVIEYEHHIRDMSVRVVQELVDTFIEGTRGGKRSGSEKAQEFLSAQIKDYEQRLAQAETRLADFKKANVGLMPGAQGDYFTRLQNQTQGLQNAQTALSLALKQRATLRSQLRGEQPFMNAGGATQQTSNQLQPMALSSGTTSRIREAQARLDELLLRFTEKHPEVVELKSTLKELEQRLADEIEAARRGDGAAAARVGLAANPVYQQIQLQFNQNELQITGLQADLANRRREVASLEALVNTAPNVEAEFAQLNRGYDVTKTQYQTLLQRLDRARLGEEADEKGVVNIEIIDPPSASFDPVAPNRQLMIAFVLALGLGAGGALAYGLHLLKPVYFSVQSLAHSTGLPVLGVVPRTWIDNHRSAFRRNVMRYSSAVAGLALCGVLLIVLQARLGELVRSLTS